MIILIFREVIDINKKKCIKRVWYLSLLIFLDKIFKYESYLCSNCYDLMQKAINFNNVAIVSAKSSDYWIPFWYMSRGDAINIMKNSDLNEKSGPL